MTSNTTKKLNLLGISKKTLLLKMISSLDPSPASVLLRYIACTHWHIIYYVSCYLSQFGQNCSYNGTTAEELDPPKGDYISIDAFPRGRETSHKVTGIALTPLSVSILSHLLTPLLPIVEWPDVNRSGDTYSVSETRVDWVLSERSQTNRPYIITL